MHELRDIEVDADNAVAAAELVHDEQSSTKKRATAVSLSNRDVGRGA